VQSHALHSSANIGKQLSETFMDTTIFDASASGGKISNWYIVTSPQKYQLAF